MGARNHRKSCFSAVVFTLGYLDILYWLEGVGMMGYRDSLAQTDKCFAAFDIWYELHRAQFWGWVVVVIVALLIYFEPWEKR